MAKKRIVKKKASKKPTKKQIKKNEIIVKNFILFIILFILSFILYTVSNQDMYTNLFFMLSVVFGFVTIAFLITYLIFFFMKVMRK